jgi:hypothetical protein
MSSHDCDQTIDSDITKDLLVCGAVEKSDEEVIKSNRRIGNICLFVREVGQPYAYFGKVSVAEVNLATKPIRITWTLNDFEDLRECSEYQRIVKLSSSL